MAYVEKILLPDERILCITTIHWIVYTQGFLLMIFGGVFGYMAPHIVPRLVAGDAAMSLARILGGVAVLIVIVGALLFFFAYLKQVATELAVTNRRVIAKYGIISRMTYEIMVDRITGANFEQSLMGRMLGFGNVLVHGAGGDISPFEKIGNPEGFHKALMQVIERGQVMVKR